MYAYTHQMELLHCCLTCVYCTNLVSRPCTHSLKSFCECREGLGAKANTVPDIFHCHTCVLRNASNPLPSPPLPSPPLPSPPLPSPPLPSPQGTDNLHKLTFRADKDGFFLYAKGDERTKAYVSWGTIPPGACS